MAEKMGKREIQKREKRKNILDAAIKSFSENGYDSTTIQMIANSVEISFGSVFTYFKTKELLYETAVIEPLNEFKEQLLTINYDSTDIYGEIFHIVKENIRLFSRNRIYLRLIQQALGRVDKHPAIAEQLDAFYSEFIDKLTPLIEKGQERGKLLPGDPSIIASSYFSFINGIRLTIGVDEDHAIWDQMVHQAIRLFGPTEEVNS